MLALHATDQRANHRAGQQRILTGIFEVAAVAWVALQVDAARQQDVEALLPCLAAHGRAAGEGDFAVPAGGGGWAGRHCGGEIARADAARISHADTGIGRLLRRDAQPRYARHEAGRTDRTFRQRATVFAQPEVAVQHLELLILGHRLQQQRSARIGVEGGVHPWLFAVLVGGIGQGQQGGAQGAALHLERRTAGGTETIAEIAGIGFRGDTRRIEACGLGRFTGHRTEQHRRCTQPRTGDQRRSCAAPAPASV